MFSNFIIPDKFLFPPKWTGFFTSKFLNFKRKWYWYSRNSNIVLHLILSKRYTHQSQPVLALHPEAESQEKEQLVPILESFSPLIG